MRAARFRSGFVAIVGSPNVGKSTLLNRMLGEKISITSEKPQTTRHRILGVVHRPGAQILFLDTPGIHKATKPLNIRIVETAMAAMADVDLILMVADAQAPDEGSEALLLQKLRSGGRPVVLALNKIDRIEKSALLKRIDLWSRRFDFLAVVPVSAKDGTQVDVLVGTLERGLPEGPPYYPEDTLTDQNQRFLAAEMIREKVFRFTGEEIPYATAVTVEAFDEGGPEDPVRIHATIHLERESQKGIVIGRGGAMLKRIGTEARREIEGMVGKKVYLKLFVRIEKNWSRDAKALRRFGY